jgi:hypothetical protein
LLDENANRKARLSENPTLQAAFARIDRLPSPDRPEASNYDDFQYNDCGHDDSKYDR